jgi:hypothetical protein
MGVVDPACCTTWKGGNMGATTNSDGIVCLITQTTAAYTGVVYIHVQSGAHDLDNLLRSTGDAYARTTVGLVGFA